MQMIWERQMTSQWSLGGVTMEVEKEMHIVLLGSCPSLHIQGLAVTSASWEMGSALKPWHCKTTA